MEEDLKINEFIENVKFILIRISSQFKHLCNLDDERKRWEFQDIGEQFYKLALLFSKSNLKNDLKE